jgi:hypothetical protein
MSGWKYFKCTFEIEPLSRKYYITVVAINGKCLNSFEITYDAETKTIESFRENRIVGSTHATTNNEPGWYMRNGFEMITPKEYDEMYAEILDFEERYTLSVEEPTELKVLQV